MDLMILLQLKLLFGQPLVSQDALIGVREDGVGWVEARLDVIK